MNLTEDELRMTIRAVHEAYIEAYQKDQRKKARILESARDKLEE